MKNPALIIATLEAQTAAIDEKTLEDRLKAAMNATKNHWMLTNEDDRFRAAIGAVLVLSNENDKKRITDEIYQLKLLNAVLDGMPVREDAFKKLKNPIGLMKMWGDIDETIHPS